MSAFALGWLLVGLGAVLAYAVSAPRRAWDPVQAVLVGTAYVFGLTVVWFASGHAVAAWIAGVALGAATGRWNRNLVLGGMGLGATERLALKLAWRRGGVLELDDLVAAGADPDTARAALTALEERGLCRRDGALYHFER